MFRLHIDLKGAISVCVFLVIILINPYIQTYAQSPLNEEEIKIGILPEINIFEQVRRYELLKSYLTKKTGIKISFSIVKSHGDIVDLFYGLDLDGAFFGSLTALLANTKIEIEPVARIVDIYGHSTCRGYILIRKDSGIKDVRGLKGKTMAFVDKASTTGYIFPVAYLKERGVRDTNRYFSEYFFSGSHDAAIKSVLEKKADVTAVKSTVYQYLADNDPRISKELMVIAESMEFPSNTLWLSKHIDRDIRAKIKKALIDMDNDKEGMQTLRQFGAKGFIDTTIGDYKNVFLILKKAGIKDLSTYDYYNK